MRIDRNIEIRNPVFINDRVYQIESPSTPKVYTKNNIITKYKDIEINTANKQTEKIGVEELDDLINKVHDFRNAFIHLNSIRPRILSHKKNISNNSVLSDLLIISYRKLYKYLCLFGKLYTELHENCNIVDDKTIQNEVTFYLGRFPARASKDGCYSNIISFIKKFIRSHYNVEHSIYIFIIELDLLGLITNNHFKVYSLNFYENVIRIFNHTIVDKLSKIKRKKKDIKFQSLGKCGVCNTFRIIITYFSKYSVNVKLFLLIMFDHRFQQDVLIPKHTLTNPIKKNAKTSVFSKKIVSFKERILKEIKKEIKKNSSSLSDYIEIFLNEKNYNDILSGLLI